MKTVHDPDGPSNKKKGRPSSEHAGQRNVPCEQCGKIYASFRVLQIHMHTIHLGERPHKCDHCEAKFTQRGNTALLLIPCQTVSSSKHSSEICRIKCCERLEMREIETVYVDEEEVEKFAL